MNRVVVVGVGVVGVGQVNNSGTLLGSKFQSATKYTLSILKQGELNPTG